MAPRSFLRYSADRRSLFLVALAALLSLSPFLLAALHPAAWALVVLWFASLYARSHAPYAQHNHAHLSVFRARPLNAVYDAVLTLVTGYPTALWELHHNIGHHQNFLDPENDVASILDPSTGRPVSRLWYMLRGNGMILTDSFRIARQLAAKDKPKLLRKLRLELALQVILLALLLVWNAKLATLFFVVPNLFAAALVWWESYVHHLGTPGTNVYDGSVTVFGKRFNRANFNIGHHTAHHEKPTLHWSLLPRRTEQIAGKIPASCMRKDPGPGSFAPAPAAECYVAHSSAAPTQ
ncbi:MAG TPA: fatty acid desaturase [Polyangiaceae bacterium]